MSDTPNPEQVNWYEQLEPLQDIFGSRFSLYTDGYVDMDPMCFDYDVVINGGITDLVEKVDTYSIYPEELFRIIKSRLGISRTSFVGDTKSWRNQDQRLRIAFQGMPLHDEANFFIALSEATSKNPVERILEERRTLGSAVLTIDKEPAEKDKIDEFKAKIDEMHVPHYHSADLVEKMYVSPAIRGFVEAFTEMRHAHETGNRALVVRIISQLPELQAVANKAMSLGQSEEWRQEWEDIRFILGDYIIVMGYTIADIKHPEFVNRYPLKVVRNPRRELSPNDLGKLKLAVVPRKYEEARKSACDDRF